MKLWIDDVRLPPGGYRWCKSVNEAIMVIQLALKHDVEIYEIDIDHDAGEYAKDGGDYIKLLDWMEETGYTPNAIHIHSMNPVGVENLRRVIQHNNWKEV